MTVANTFPRYGELVGLIGDGPVAPLDGLGLVRICVVAHQALVDERNTPHLPSSASQTTFPSLSRTVLTT